MAAVRTLSHLQDGLDQEIAWRIKEIGTFRIEASKGGHKSKAFTRAGVALLYAHWEGFVKSSAELYLEFVSNRGLKYEDLGTCFVVFGLKSKLNALIESRKSAANIEAVDFIRDSLGDLAALKLSGAVNTESNLSSSVFENIALSIGVSTTPYKTRFNLIDSSLVERRNKIAHGEYLDLKSSDFATLIDEVLSLMRLFKNDLINAAATEAYRRST